MEMIENLKNINDRKLKLDKFTEKDLEALYLRVFNSEDGELVMQDLAERCFVYETTEEDELAEGMRAAWLTIQSRLLGAVAPEQKKES